MDAFACRSGPYDLVLVLVLAPARIAPAGYAAEHNLGFWRSPQFPRRALVAAAGYSASWLSTHISCFASSAATGGGTVAATAERPGRSSMHFLDGEPVSDARLLVPALSNYGCLTTMAVADGRVRGLGMHLDRLRQDTALLFGGALLFGDATPFGGSAPSEEGSLLGASEIRRLVREAVAAGGERHTVARVTVLAADFDIGRPDRPCRLSVLVSLRPAPSATPPEPLRVRSTAFSRDVPHTKHVGLFGQLYQRRLARIAGYDDALFVDSHGRLSEGTTWNIGFADDDGRLVWPASAEMLSGVTMRLVRSAAERAGTPSVEVPLTPRAVAGLPAAFATSAVTGIRQIGRVDDHDFPDEAGVVARLAERYLADPGEPL